MLKIKICGITNQEDALMAVEFGADALGFVFAKGPRQVNVEKVLKITENLPPFIVKVGVFVNEVPWVVQKVFKDCNLNAVQLHGEEIPEVCQELFPIPIIKSLRIREEKDIKTLTAYPPIAAFLLDSYVEAKPGGTGKTFPWNWVKKANKLLNRPIILAGGLTPSNVKTAVREADPHAVDVSSGVESKPGKKDKNKLKLFIKKAKGCK